MRDDKHSNTLTLRQKAILAYHGEYGQIALKMTELEKTMEGFIPMTDKEREEYGIPTQLEQLMMYEVPKKSSI